MQTKKNKVIGILPVTELLKTGHRIEKIFFQDRLNDRLVTLLKTAKQQDIPTSIVPKVRINKLSQSNHQGVVAFLSFVDYLDFEELIIQIYENKKLPFIIMIDSVTDTRNIGSIARTAEAAGVDGILLNSQGKAFFGEDTMKTSAGALLHLKISRTKNLEKAIKYFQNCGGNVVALTEKAEKSIYNTSLQKPIALLVGAEDRGIHFDAMKLVNDACRIDMFGKINSLNVSVAAAIGMYEIVKQNK